MKHYIILLLVFFSFKGLGKKDHKPFSLSISGNSEDLPSLKKMGDLIASKAVGHCRGAYIPFPVSPWGCLANNTCKREYQCKRINKKFSRITEISKAKKNLNKVKKIKYPYKISWSNKIKIPSFDGSKAVLKIKKYKKKLKIFHKEKRKAKKRKELEFIKIKKVILAHPLENKEKSGMEVEDVLEDEALALIEKEDTDRFDNVQRMSSMYQDSKIERMPFGKDHPYKVSPKTIGPTWKLLTLKEDDATEKTYRLEKVDPNSIKGFIPQLKLINVSFSYVNISSKDSGKVGTPNFSWAPQYIYLPNWAIRLDFGVQFFTVNYLNQYGIKISDTTFAVVPMQAYINYLGKFYFLEAGAGFQTWWMQDKRRVYFSYSLGFGYRFPITTTPFDRIFFNFDGVSAPGNVQQLKLGMAFRF